MLNRGTSQLSVAEADKPHKIRQASEAEIEVASRPSPVPVLEV